MTRSFLFLSGVAAFTVGVAQTHAQLVLYVDDSAPPGGDALSWNSAARSLQDAIGAAASGSGQVSEIRVGQGLYRPDAGLAQTPGDRLAAFTPPSGVPLLGGFAGFGAPNPDARDVALFPTVLSGDLLGDDGPNFTNYTDNSKHVVVARPENTGCVLDGLIIRSGYAHSAVGPPVDDGAGLDVLAANATVVQCTFALNLAPNFGGGASVANGSASFTDCMFVGNWGQITGGAVRIIAGSGTLLRCHFEANRGNDSSGVECRDGRLVVDECAFVANTGGPALYTSTGSISRIMRTEFLQNTDGALAGGGRRIWVEGCTFRENQGSAFAGNATTTSVVGCRFIANSAPHSGAVGIDGPGTQVGLYAAGPTAIHKWNGTEWSAVAASQLGGISAMVPFDDGFGAALFVGGAFTSLAGVPATARVAAIDGGGPRSIGGADGPVNCFAVYNDGRGPALYAGGDFQVIGGVSASRVARWSGGSWEPVGGGADGPVRALTVADLGAGPRLFAGGSFSIAGSSSAQGLAAWDGNHWTQVGGGVNGTVSALASLGSPSRLGVGGQFSIAGSGPAFDAATWDGAHWNNLQGGANASVRAVAAWDTAAAFYIGGEFLTVGGGTPATRIARWTGAQWTTLGAGLNGPCSALIVGRLSSGPERLYAGGSFTQAGSVLAPGIAEWSGNAWGTLGGGVFGGVTALAIYDPYDSIVRDCVFLGNHTSQSNGGAVRRARLVVNCLMSGNSARNGGATYDVREIQNCSIVGNTAAERGGGVHLLASPRISNSIIYYNNDTNGNSETSQVYTSGIQPLVHLACIQGWSGVWGGGGNHGSNPALADRDGPDNTTGTEDDDLSLLPHSPCIEQGSPFFWTHPLHSDIAGATRIADGDLDGIAILDAGALEFSVASCYANCDQSTTHPALNVADFSCFLQRFAAGNSYANCDGSTMLPVLNIADFTCFLGRFAAGCN